MPPIVIALCKQIGATGFGYTNLGQLSSRFSGTNGLTIDQVKSVVPASGKGIEITGVANYPFKGRYAAFARLGFLWWEAEYTLSSGETSRSRSTGIDALLGLGVDATIKNGWGARIAWDRYRLRGTESQLFTIGLKRDLPS